MMLHDVTITIEWRGGGHVPSVETSKLELIGPWRDSLYFCVGGCYIVSAFDKG